MLSSLFDSIDFILNCKVISLYATYKAAKVGATPILKKEEKKEINF